MPMNLYPGPSTDATSAITCAPPGSPDGQTLAFDLREPKRRAIWTVGRNFVEACLARASIAQDEIGFGAGLCPEALRTATQS
jgi:hypothetical protein